MTRPTNVMSTRANRWVITAASAALIFGAILSRVIEPGVRVEKIMLTTNTPALRLFPATPGPHPIALLAHGNVRIQYEGAIYHVMSRGNGKAAVFHNDVDRRSFVQTLGLGLRRNRLAGPCL